MKADTVDLLTTKAHFPTDEAVAVAEAIDVTIRDAQLVTVPVLDARFIQANARIDSRFAETDAKMEKGFAEVKQRFIETDAKVEKRFAEADAKVEKGFTELKAQIERSESKAAEYAMQTNHKFERLWWKFTIVILVGSAAMRPLGNNVIELIKHAF